MSISIRATLTGLIVLCVVLTAFVCMYMTIRSGDSELNDVKSVRDSSVGGCFNVSEENLEKASENMIARITANAMDQVTGYFRRYEDLVRGNIALLETPDGSPMANESDYLKKMWKYKTVFFQQVNMYKLVGVKNSGTTWLPTYGIDYIVTDMNTSDITFEYNDAGNQKVAYRIGVDASDVGSIPYIPMVDLSPPPCAPFPLMYNKTICATPLTRDPTITTFVISIIQPGPENVRWGRIFAGAGYIVTVLLGTWRNDAGIKTGTDYISISLDLVSQFLATIDMGTPRGRLFTVIRTDWMSFGATQQLGWLTGTSHGKATWGFEDSSDPNFDPNTGRHAYWATDNVIRKAAEWIHGHNATTNVSGYEALLGQGVVQISLETTVAPNEVFFLSVSRLLPGPGLDWYIVALIDREYLMGATDAALVETKTEIDKSSKKVDDDLKASRTVVFITVAVIVVCLAGVSVVLVYFITYPLTLLEEEMSYVACMKLEEVDVTRPPSFLNEVRLMQRSFLQMIANIKEYRKFMPASVLCEDDDASSDSPQEASSKTSSKDRTRSRTRSQSRTEASSIARNKATHAVQKLQLGDMKTRDSGIIVVNKRGALQDTSFAAGHEQYLESVLFACTEAKGLPESFYGDTVFMTWNAVKPVSQYYIHMCSCALKLKEIPNTSIGVATGKSKVGNMGCGTMRRFSYIGYTFPGALLAEKLNKVYGSKVLGMGLNEAVTQHFLTKIVDKIVLQKMSSKPVLLLEVMGVKKVAEEEWMYQLEQGEANDPYSIYNKAAQDYINENYADAEETLKPMMGNNPDAQVIDMYNRIVSAKEGRKIIVDNLPLKFF